MVLPTRGGSQRGFIYLALLIGIFTVGIGLSAVSVVWQQARQREREAELLFAGDQIRAALTRYYLESPPGQNRFPDRLEDLLEDVRLPGRVRRPLRRLYPDPMTGTGRWGEVRLSSGQLVGVYSMSQSLPLKQAGFDAADKSFEAKSGYSDWVFRSPLPAANPLPGTVRAMPGAGSGAPAVVVPPPMNDPPGVTRPIPRPRR